MDLIVDAYNLIFQCGLEGPKRNPASITKSRSRLIDLLAGLLSVQQRSNTTVVFDAKRLPPQESQIESRKCGIRILFAVGYESADEMIEELIASHSHPKDLLVISSDHRIQNAATRRKAKAIDSDVWLDQIENQPRGRDQSTKKNTNRHDQQASSNKQVASEIKSLDWKAEFGVESNQASDELVREIENELGLHGVGDANDKQTIDAIEDDLKDVDWMREFGLDDDLPSKNT